MLIIPAIDLKDEHCVSGRRGSIEDATVFSSNPLAMAREWVRQGARRLHLVDLDGAEEGEPVNGHVIRAIAHEFSTAGIPVHVGGGVRSAKAVESYIESGVDYVLLGTAIVTDPSLLYEVCRHFRGHIMAAVDVRDGRIVTDAWSRQRDIDALELVKELGSRGIDGIVYSDVERDGMMEGLNVDEAVRLARASRVPLFVSGGVGSMEHIESLHARREENIRGVIVGRALYERRVDLHEARRRFDPT